MNEARDHGTTLIYRCGGRCWRRRGLRDGGGTNGKGGEGEAATRARAARRDAATAGSDAGDSSAAGGSDAGDGGAARRRRRRGEGKGDAAGNADAAQTDCAAEGGGGGDFGGQLLFYPSSIKTNTKGRYCEVLKGIEKYFQTL